MYGDQHSEGLFEFFCEKNMLALFTRFLSQKWCGPAVKQQIVQTISILAQNISNETSLCASRHVSVLALHTRTYSPSPPSRDRLAPRRQIICCPITT